MTGPGNRRWRPPRWIYWLAGAAVACSGALIANLLSADLPVAERGPYWLAGSAVIFLGLWILSQGTGAARDRDGDGRG